MVERHGGGLSVVLPDGVRTELSGRDEWVIGRGRDAGVRVAGEVVGRRHAVVRREGPGWAVHDLGSLNGLWRGGHRVSRVDLGVGELTVHLGGPDGVPVTFLLSPAVQPAAGPAPAAGPVRQPPVPMPQMYAGPAPAGYPGQGYQPPRQEALTAAPARWPPSRPTALNPPADGGLGHLVAAHPLEPGVLEIGRGSANRVVLDDLLVSRRHAVLEVGMPGGPLRLVDLGSANGTFVNGQRVTTTPVNPGDRITIGPHQLVYEFTAAGPRLLEFDEREGVSFGAGNLTVTLPGGRQLLHDVSFSLRPRTLVAVVGPSGAGKSTLLHALAGLRPATSGRVRYAGRDLYAEYEDLSRRIGFVPQQDILHQVLTVEEALRYGAQLRFPAETTAAERNGRIREVAESLHLGEQFGTRVARLSGGERKRASTAMELLTKPSLLFLDEPTSGLDTDLDRDVMHLLRRLADEGRTVVVVTHNLDYLDVCDLVLVLARGGHTAYLGPPSRAFAYFGVNSWADLFGRLKTRAPADWGAAFAARNDRDPSSYPPRQDGVDPAAARLPPIRQQSVASQLVTLTRRYLSVIAADRTLLGILVLLPVVPGSRGLAHEPGNLDARQLLLVLVVGGCLTGAAGAVRELVKERAIYRRERAVGLSRAAYLASKILVTTGIAAVQGVVLTVLSLAGRPAPGDPMVLPAGTAEITLVVALVTAVSALVGLLISAAVSDENQAMPLLVLATMAQLVFCGGLVPVAGRPVLEQLSWLLPARWGLAAAAVTVDLPFLSTGPLGRVGTPDDLWTHDVATWWTDVGVMLGLGAVAAAITWWLLRRLDPLH